MSWNILITCEPFVQSGADAMRRLRDAGCELVTAPKFGPLTAEELTPLLNSAHAVVADLDHFTADVIRAAPKLKLIARWGVGCDAIDLDAANDRGVMVANTPGVLEETVADMTFALLLGATRGLATGHESMRAGDWSRTWGTGVHGRTLGLIGCGRIGTAVARRAKAFNLRVIAHDLAPRDEAKELGVEFYDLNSVLAESDFLSLHAALTPQTRDMLNAEAFGRMKPGAILINTARGGLVDEAALVSALNDGRIGGAALDAYVVEPLPAEHPLRTARNVLLTPHVASFTRDTGEAMGRLAADNILAALRGDRPPHLVNQPRVAK